MKVGDLLVNIGADTGDLKRGVKRAKAELATLPDEKNIKINVNFDDMLFNVQRLGKTKGLLEAIAVAVPILALGLKDAAGAAGGLASMLGAASAGAIGFGAVTVGVLNDVFDAQKDITKAQKDYAKALTADEQQTALENLQQAYLGLNEGQLAAVNSLQKFTTFWDGFKQSLQAPVIVGFSTVLEGLQMLLENLGPTIKAAGSSFVGIFQRMNDAMKGADFQKFFKWLETSVGPTLSNFGDIAINVLQGVLNIMVAFQPISEQMQGGLLGMSKAFLQWTQSLQNSQGFKDFLNLVASSGPMFIQFIKQAAIGIMDFVNAMAPLGRIMLGVLNVAGAFFNLLMGIGKGADAVRGRLDDLTKSIGQLLGFQTASAQSSADSLFDIDKAYQDMQGSIGGVSGGLKDAKKQNDKFVASFDELYQIPDKLDEVGGALPAPTVPTPPTGGNSGGSSGNNPGSTPSPDGGWIDKLLEKLKLIPAFINLPDFKWPTAPAVVTDAIQAVIDKIVALKDSLATNQPLISASLGLIALALGLPTVATSTAFDAMLVNMLNSLKTNVPSINQWLQTITDKLKGLNGETVPTSTAFDTMLKAFTTSMTANMPGVLLGLLLITSGIVGITEESPKAQTAFHDMLDFMQSKANAYTPYITYQLALITESVTDLDTQTQTTRSTWDTAFDGMTSKVENAAPRIIRQINAIIAAQRELNALTGGVTSVPSASSVPMPNMLPSDFEWGPQANTIPATAPGENEWSPDTLVSGADKSLWEQFVESGALAASMEKAGVDLGKFGLDSAATLAGIGALKKGALLKDAFKGWLEGKGMAGAIPGFAGGGIIGSEGIVRVGERNKPEAIVPLEGGAMNPFADAVASRIGDSDSGLTVNFNAPVYGGPSGMKEVARMLRREMNNENARGENS